MRFILGLLTGVVVGAAAATLSQGQSGKDLRAEFDRIRGDIEKRDFEALGSHLEERFGQLQATLEERFNEASSAAREAAVDVESSVDEAVEEVEEAVDEGEPVTA